MSNIETNVIKPELGFSYGDLEFVILKSETEKELDKKLSSIESFMEDNDGTGKEDDVKDKLYIAAQELWKDYAKLLKDIKYNFFLNRSQFKFLKDLITKKMEYDVNTVFFAIELKDMFVKMDGSNFKDDNELLSFEVNATEITYTYHLISKHTVKGLTIDSYLFSEVLMRIGDISKIFNFYETSGKNLTTDIQNWVTAFEDGVTVEKKKK